MSISRSVFVACMGLAICASASAQWTVTVLTPDAAWISRGYGMYGHQQVGDGFLKNSTSPHAFMWEGTPDSWVDLHPLSATTSVAYATDGLHQVGYATIDSVWQASLWTGTSESWTSLSPPLAQYGFAASVFGDTQVGWVSINGSPHASLWRGSAATWASLNPPDVSDGFAWGTDGTSQVGQIYSGGIYRASLWKGSASTYVDLHPAVSLGGSSALAVWGDQQVGWVSMDNEGGTNHAALWNGSAESWVDLHPDDKTGPMYTSRAYSVYQGYQVGYSDGYDMCNGFHHAALWHGSAETWENLHKHLPFHASNSVACGVWCDDTTIYVVGEVDNQAVLWTRPIDSQSPTCRADVDGNSFVNGDDFDSFAAAFEVGGELADFDFNCFVNGDDYDLFAEAFEAGC